MRRIVIVGLSSSSLFFRIFSETVRFFWKKKQLNTKCVFWFSVRLWKISHCKKNWARYDKKLWRSSCKVHVVFVRFWLKFNFSGRIFKRFRNIEFRENPSSGNRILFHADGRTDMTNVVVAFRNFSNTPKNVYYMYVILLLLDFRSVNFVWIIQNGARKTGLPSRRPTWA